jgi:hypothetical protein
VSSDDFVQTCSLRWASVVCKALSKRHGRSTKDVAHLLESATTFNALLGLMPVHTHACAHEFADRGTPLVLSSLASRWTNARNDALTRAHVLARTLTHAFTYMCPFMLTLCLVRKPNRNLNLTHRGISSVLVSSRKINHVGHLIM